MTEDTILAATGYTGVSLSMNHPTVHATYRRQFKTVCGQEIEPGYVNHVKATIDCGSCRRSLVANGILPEEHDE